MLAARVSECLAAKRNNAQNAFIVTSDEVRQFSGEFLIEAILLEFAIAIKSSARPPISNFFVGAATLADNGNIYLGVNVEFSSMPLDNAIHAEQFAISNAAFNGAKSLRLLAASATPCGHCRQFCKELHLSDELRVVFGTPSQSLMHVPLTDMLPYGFGPRELGVFEKTLLAHRPADAAARLFDIVETKTYHSSALHHRLKLSSSSTGGASSSSSSSSSSTSTSATTAVVVTTSSIQHPDDATIEQLKALAVNAAQQSYSPYTNSPAGCAILLRNATTTTTTTTTPDAQQQQQQHSFAFGYYIESCAYNPSMTAFRAALVDVTMQNRDWCDIAAVVIAELHHAKVSHFEQARTLINAVTNPNVPIFNVHLKSKSQQ